MTQSISCPARALAVASLGTVCAAVVHGQSICTTLDSPVDRKVCEKYTADRSWLTSVQKIAVGQTVPDLSASSGILYIFDSRSSDGGRAVYNLPEQVSLPGNNAIVGNGGQSEKPRLLLAETTEAQSGMKTAGFGSYLLADVEVRTQGSGIDQRVFMSEGAEAVELSGVTLSASFSPLSSISPAYQLSLLYLNADSERNNARASYNVHGCDLQVPDVQSFDGVIVFNAFTYGTSADGDDVARLNYANNTITTRNYNEEASTITRVVAIGLVGNVEIEPGSNCNSIVDHSGNDLIATDHGVLFQAYELSSTNNGAFGFTNQHAWGWQLDHGQPKSVYDSWDSWKNRGVYTQCNLTPGADDGGSSAVKIAIPIVTFVVFSALVATGMFVGYKKIPKQRWQDLRSMFERCLLRSTRTRLREAVDQDL